MSNLLQVVKSEESPLVFLSYQWGKQPQVKALYQRLTAHGYTVWMDIYQMGGGDSLYDKIDRGMRGCKAVVSCVTQKYSLSANCRREVSLADALKKPIIPLLLEDIKWPPDGPMSMVFTQLLYINFHRDEALQMTWKGDQFEELRMKLGEFVPETEISTDNGGVVSKDVSSGKSQAAKKDQGTANGAVVLEDLSPGKSQAPKKDQGTANGAVISREVSPAKSQAPKKDQGTANGAVVSKDMSPAKSQAPKKDQGTANGAVVSKDMSPAKSQAPKKDQGTANGVVVSKDMSPAKSQAPKKDQETTKRIISKERSTNSTTVQGPAGSAAGKQKRESSSGGQNSDKTPTVQKSTVKKAVAVRAFGGSIVKDKIALDIAAGNRSTTSKSGSTANKSKITNSKNGTKGEAPKTDPTPARGTSSLSGNKSSSSVTGTRSTSSVSGKGTPDGKSTTKVTSENSKTKERVGEGTKETENITSPPRQTIKDAEVKQSQNNSKQVNGGSNEPKSKSCIII